MKSKIILITIFTIVLFSSTIVLATTDLQADLSVDVNQLVGNIIQEDTIDATADFDNDIMLISMPDGEGIPVSMSEDETVSIGVPEEYWRTVGDESTITRGDVFIIKDNYTLNEYVDGNLYVLAKNVNINADVNGNVFVLANTINISGYIYGSLYGLGEWINIENAQITDVYLASSNDITIKDTATITREAKMSAESIIIDGAIAGDLYSNADTVILNEGAIVTGNVLYSGTLNEATEGQIGGVSEKYETSNVESTIEKADTAKEKLTSILFKTFTALLIIGLIVLASSKKAEVNLTVEDCIKGVFGGLLWVILIPFISILLIITIFGIPFAILVILIYIALYFIAIPATSLQMTTYLLEKNNNNSKVLLWLLSTIVYCVIAIIRMIPAIGTWVTALFGLYGFNLIIKTVFSKKKKTAKDESAVVENKENTEN